MKLYTMTGDAGLTDTLDGRRISKSDLLVELIGTMDEFTSSLGMARAIVDDDEIGPSIIELQRDLLLFNAELSGGTRFISDPKIKDIEKQIDQLQGITGEFHGFILPGDDPGAAALDIARTVVRRAERIAVGLREEDRIQPLQLIYINRLSDLVYSMARVVEYKARVKEIVRRVVEKLELIQSRSGDEKLTLEKAKRLALEIEKKAQESGVCVVVAIADEGGNLMLMHRMEDAFIASVDIAINKAYTCVALKMTTEEVGKLSQPGSPLYGLQYTNQQRIVVFGGGVPLKLQDKVLGGLGVSGGTAEQDTRLAEYGAQLFEGRLNT